MVRMDGEEEKRKEEKRGRKGGGEWKRCGTTTREGVEGKGVREERKRKAMATGYEMVVWEKRRKEKKGRKCA